MQHCIEECLQQVDTTDLHVKSRAEDLRVSARPDFRITALRVGHLPDA